MNVIIGIIHTIITNNPRVTSPAISRALIVVIYQ
jgi:hypothetical protein